MSTARQTRQLDATKTGPRPQAFGWRRILAGRFAHPEEVPRLWGLALVACFVGALFAIVFVAISFHQDALVETLAREKEQVLLRYASRAASLLAGDRVEAAREMARLRGEHGLEYCAIHAGDDSVFAQSHLLSPGVPADIAVDTRLHTVHAPLIDATGAVVGEFRAAHHIDSPTWPYRASGLWLGLVVLTALALLLILYRMLRRLLRPLAKVRDRLLVYSKQMESRLDELTVEDERSAITDSWNQILRTTATLRSALEGMESQRELIEALRHHDASQAADALEWHPDGIVLVDEFAQVALINKACRALVRARDDDVVGKPASSISRDAELNQVIERLTSAAARNHLATVYHALSEDGLSTTLAITVAEIQSERVPSGALLVFRDASQQKQAEKARDDFLHQVTHEFRTPLSNIRAYTETLMEGILEDRDAQRECLNVINAEAARLGRLVEEVLTASQLEVGTARLRLSEVDLARLLQQAVQDLQASADERNVELHMKLPPKVPKIRGDKDRLAVVFNNLLGNAVKYTDAGDSVTLACEDRGRDLEITVTDTGLGISEEDLPHIFDKFYRSSSEQVEKRPGTGLGLATARQIVRLHGGEITATSTIGEGSCFSVTLPVYEVQSFSGARALSTAAASQGDP
ncbi:MAG: PAS domain S-box protein [Phycisphaerales bacterium]|nr:MAG: PAS domain S-box protein [Phycisphaerales bacterium]